MRSAQHYSLTVLLFCLALLNTAAAGSGSNTSVAVRDAWARATAPGAATAAIYFRAEANAEADRLIGAATPVAGKAMLHQTIEEKGQSRMEHVDGVDIGPDSPIEFAPGGYHVMLTKLDHQLKEGETIPLTLTFENAGAIDVRVPVVSRAALGPDS